MQPQMQMEVQAQIGHKSGGEPVRWGLGTRVIFRFFFAYFFLYVLPFPFGWIAHTDYLAGKYRNLWHAVVPWVGQHLLHLSYPITVFSNGSGDTTYDYVQVLCFLVLAITATAVWSVVDRKRPNYQKLQQWFRIGLRLWLGTILIYYGMSKVIKLQFPAPYLSRLLSTYGESTPMGLLWTCMGASKSYTIFAGAVELLGGVLLFIPRLTLVGALVTVAAMGNVFMLNMSYDVPVKLFSFHLLAMSVLLTYPDLRRLADLFVFNRRVDPAPNPPLFQRKWLNYGVGALQLVFGVYMLVTVSYADYQTAKARGDDAPKPPLYGMWLVDEFALNGEEHPPVPTDDLRWERVIFDSPSELFLQSMNGSHRRFLQRVDPSKKTVTLRKRESQDWKAQFSFATVQPGVMTLEGKLDGQTIRARLHHVPDPTFMLTRRGFHWINEYPFNRFNE